MAPLNGSHVIVLAFMAARRGWGSDTIYSTTRGRARTRPGTGRWREAISLGSGPEGHLIRRKISGKTKAIVADQLAQLHRDLDAGARLRATRSRLLSPASTSRHEPSHDPCGPGRVLEL